MELVSLLTSTTSKGNPNAWDISKAYYDAGADAWDVSKAFSSGVTFSVVAQEDLNESLFFKPDGTKMYICGRRGDDVNEYTLSTPWLVSSATYVQNFSIASQEGSPTGLFFKPDGTKMYVCGYGNDSVYEYNLSTAWDVSSSSYVQSFSIATEEITPQSLSFKTDGTKMYVLGNTGDDVNEYDLSTPWDISTASYVQNFSVSAQDTGPTGLFFKPDGTKMYVTGASGNDVNEYSLSSAWDVSTASFVTNFALGGAFLDIFFHPDGSGFYVTSLNAVYQYTIGGFSVAAQETAPQGLFFKPDGTKMYVIGSTGDDVNEYDLSTAWDITTASYLQNFSVAGQDSTPQALFFKPDGTKMYVLGNTNDSVYEYSLSSAWDISTASYIQSKSVSAQDNTPLGLFFKPDGTTMYIAGNQNDSVYEFSLSTAWDISSSSLTQTFSVSTQEAAPSGVFFDADGTKMYVSGLSGDDINQYSLSSAWDISTASYVQNFSVLSEGTNPDGFFWKPDGTQFWVIFNSQDKVFSYLISPT